MRLHTTLLLTFLLAACGDDPSPDTGTEPSDVDQTDDDVSADGDTAEGDTADGGQQDVPDLAEPDSGPTEIPTAPAFDPIEHTQPVEGMEPSGHAEISEALSEGEVRAGLVTDWDHGFAGQEVDCRPGDFKLYNSRVQFCIAGPTSITSMLYSGGQVIDADRVGADNDRLFLAGTQSHFMLASAEEVSVLSDGRDGQAVVVSRGGDEALKIADDYLGPLFRPRGVTFETEYRLLPDEDYLEIITWVRSGERNQAIIGGDVIFGGDTTVPFFPGTGRQVPPINTNYEYLVTAGTGRSYGVWAEGGMSNFVSLDELADFPLFPTSLAKGAIPAGHEGGFRRYLIVGDGDSEGIRSVIRELSGEAPLEQGIQLTLSEGEAAAPGVAVVVSDADGLAVTLLVTDDTGRAQARLPVGAYTAAVEDWPAGVPAVVELNVVAGEFVEATIPLAATGRLSVTVRSRAAHDAELVASPAKLELFGDAHYRLMIGRDQPFEAVVAPGSYRAVISRGEAYSAVVLDALEVSAGETISVEAELLHVWDTAGLISGEFHQHCTRSFDSPVTETDRVMSNIVEGVDFVVPTDHDAITDFTPWIEELGAEDLIFSMPATEVSPSFAHLNTMPMPFDPLLPAGGAFSFGRRQDDGSVDHLTFPQIVEELRADWGVEVVQVNHPRSSSGFFDSVGYAPLTGPDAVNPSRFTADFDSMEVFNGSSEFCTVARDWLSLVARGHRVTGVGNSDSHGLSREAGYPRSYLSADVTSPDQITQDHIIDALLAGDVSVSGGALITFPGGPELGSVVTTDESELSLAIRVQTPQWATVERLLVVVNGQIAVDREINAETAEIIAFDEAVTVPLPDDKDAYLVVFAFATTRMPHVTPGERPFGFTNPVFFDADGVEGWTPPGVVSEDDLLTLPIPWCD